MSAYRPVSAGISRTIADAETCSLKRLAWAYGCAPKGSAEEMQLEMLLMKRAAGDLVEIAASWSAVASEAIVDGERHRVENDAMRAQLDEIRQDAMDRNL